MVESKSRSLASSPLTQVSAYPDYPGMDEEAESPLLPNPNPP